uniref:Tetratricopeptide repeat protein n=1 Tax=candidate division WOR-3 bacterium TaxID=2052148 RepID=A0A7C2K558_UNCW3
MIFRGSGGGDFKSKKLQAQKLIGQGKYDEALELLLELSKTASDPEIFNSIGDLYIRKQNHEKALEYLEKAYKMYKEQDFRDIAVSIAKKILRLDKERHDVYLDLIQMELEGGNVDRALDWALEYIKLPHIDAVYLGKLFNLINEFANVIQEHTEQASKFERLFMRVQELAESLAMISLESGIEFAQPQEFYEHGDVGGLGGFFSEPQEEGTAVSGKPRKKEEKEEVEKLEFIEKEEFEEEPQTFITSSGFADFLGVPSPESQKAVSQEFKSSGEKIVFEEEEEEIPVEQISEKTLVVEETPITEEKATIVELPEEIEKISVKPNVEEFKTVVEEAPEEVEEIQKEWESTLKKVTERKSEKPFMEEGIELEQELSIRDFGGIAEEKRPAEERIEELEESLGKDFITLEKETEKKAQPVERKSSKTEETKGVREFETSKKFVLEEKTEKRPSEKPVAKTIPEPGVKKRIEGIEAEERYEILLRVLKELKEDILTLEEWPYPSDPPFEVAKEYYEMKLYQPAIEEFQKLLGDPRYRLQSMIFLGRIFYERGDLELAEVILRKAVEEVGTLDKDYIEAYYYLALTLESMKRYHEAKEFYTNVYVFDSRFRDVEEKIKSLRSMGI